MADHFSRVNLEEEVKNSRNEVVLMVEFGEKSRVKF